MRYSLAILVSVACFLPDMPNALADTAADVRTAQRVFLEKLGQGRFDKLNEIYGPGFVAHGASRTYTLEEDNASVRAWRSAVPDLKITIERTATADGLVAVHWKGRGTNTVQAGGMPGKGNNAHIDGMTFFRFSSGRIVEEWTVVDVATLSKLLE
jgi:steroid delta-isomerase-like uncharacterized protein